MFIAAVYPVSCTFENKVKVWDTVWTSIANTYVTAIKRAKYSQGVYVLSIRVHTQRNDSSMLSLYIEIERCCI